MLGERKIDPELDTRRILDKIEGAVLTAVKPYGFKRYGRTLHRFVSGDISQVIHFQLGPAHWGQTHLLYVNVGIRVPECVTRSFEPEENPQKYYHEYDCNMRSRLGKIEGKQESCYDLRNPADLILSDILRQLQEILLPAFETLNSRDAILAHRRDYPLLDIMNAHLILLEEAMIYGRRGQRQKAETTFCLYYHLTTTGQGVQKDHRVIQNHLNYLGTLAEKLEITL